MNDSEGAIAGIIALAVAATLMLFVASSVIVLLPAILIGAVVVGGIYYHHHSPKYLEKKAREHTHALYEEARTRYQPQSPEELAARVVERVPETPIAYTIAETALRIIEEEGIAAVPEPPMVCNSLEGARYRDKLSNLSQYTSPDEAVDVLADAFGSFVHTLPDLHGESGLTVPLIGLLKNPGVAIEALIFPLFEDHGLFTSLKRQLDQNLAEVSGHKEAVLPSAYEGENIAYAYLKDTPLLQLLDMRVPFGIPPKVRFEHQWIVAGTGHGKTQTLQYLIAHDLPDVADGEASVVVIDSQGDLIKTISRLDCFAPGGQLDGKLCLIDPTDIEYPVALNLFDLNMARIDRYSQLDRERLINSVLELYDFVLGSLLSAELTQKQSVMFRYITRLMLYIPDANIQTFRRLLEPDGYDRYREHIDELEGTARAFFETEFNSKEFEQTKRQVVRRLWGILENQTFERMFSHPRNKLDLFTEMNTGKVILISTAKDLLKQNGTEIFGRFFIAMIAQAAQERATLAEADRRPTYVYIDECQDYLDQNVSLILESARKYRVGIILAHQYVGQLSTKLQDSFAANTSVKFAGGVSSQDARLFARHLRCQPSFIEDQPTGHFAAFVRGATDTAVSLRVPFGVMEDMPRMTAEDEEALRASMRDQYAVHWSEVRETINGELRPHAAREDADTVSTDASSEW